MKVSVKIAEVLIEAGCDPSLRTNDGKTAIMLAIEQVSHNQCFLKAVQQCTHKKKVTKKILYAVRKIIYSFISVFLCYSESVVAVKKNMRVLCEFLFYFLFLF